MAATSLPANTASASRTKRLQLAASRRQARTDPIRDLTRCSACSVPSELCVLASTDPIRDSSDVRER